MPLRTVKHTCLPIIASFALLWLGTSLLQRRVDALAARSVSVEITTQPVSPYAPFAASLGTRRTEDDYRTQLQESTAFREGRLAFGAAAYQEAEGHFRQVLNTYPDNLVAVNQLGLVARRLGHDAEAQALWNSILKEDSAYVAAHLNLGVLYSSRGDIAEAERSYRMAIRFSPFYSRAHYNLGLFLLKHNRYHEAEDVLRKAADLSSGEERARALNSLGRSLAATGQQDAAMRVLREAIELKPDYVLARMNLADLYPDTEDGRTARREAYDAILRLRPDYQPALEELEEFD